MREQVKKPHMGGLLALLLFGVFAVCVLSVLLTGADAYQRLTERDRASYDQRTAAQYIATKVRQGDAAGAVALGEFDGASALLLSQEIDGETYITYLYYEDGYIRELFTAQGGEFLRSDGEKILEARDLRFLPGEAPGVLHVELTGPDGDTAVQILALRSGEEAAS